MRISLQLWDTILRCLNPRAHHDAGDTRLIEGDIRGAIVMRTEGECRGGQVILMIALYTSSSSANGIYV